MAPPPWAAAASSHDAAERFAVATQLQLTWWRFSRHKLAMVSLVVVVLFYVVAIVRRLPGDHRSARHQCAHQLHRRRRPCISSTTARSDPYVNGLKGVRDLEDLQAGLHRRIRTGKLPCSCSRTAIRYSLLRPDPDRHPSVRPEGPAARRRHLSARHRPAGPRPVVAADGGDAGLADRSGWWASPSAWCSAFCWAAFPRSYGGVVDTLIQRLIEVVRSIPTIPLWLGLAAAMPNSWSVTQVYFAITIIISLLGVDRPGARRARQIPGAARGGFRHGGRTGRRLASCASSSATCCRASPATSSPRSASRCRR